MRVGQNFCPGILHAVPAKDGFLMRIRIPGGLLLASQLRAIAKVAESCADGEIEVTSRANLQLRGIAEDDLATAAEMLRSAALLPSEAHDRVRNVVTSPLAGLDAEELLDTRTIIRELDAHLVADATLTRLHPKFTLGIDGGGRRFSHDIEDLSLRAIKVDGEVRFRLSIGGADSTYTVLPGASVECMMQAARICVSLAEECTLPVRGKKLLEVDGGMNRITQRLAHLLIEGDVAEDTRPVLEAPIGVSPGVNASKVNVVPSIPLGRMTAAQVRCLCDVASRWDLDLRLAPWRGVALGGVLRSEAEVVIAQLEAAGLACDQHDGYYGLAACAGITGCDASLADVRGDARLIASRLAGRQAIPGWTVNLSGCEKQCAMRHGASVELIATGSAYTVRTSGLLSQLDAAPTAAIDAVYAAHSAMIAQASA